jgi:hypothetical protein
VHGDRAELRRLLTRRILAEGQPLLPAGVDVVGVAVEILALADRDGDPAGDGIRLRATVDGLALRTGRTRAEVVHTLRIMRMLGWAELGPGQITLLRVRER